jgi:glycosyltransferase involved in cell wall biosynthesis
MACGCPVVASDIPPHREILGEAAHIVDPHAPEAIARGVRDVVTNDDLAAKLRRNGAALTGRLTWAKAAARLLAVIRAQTA